MATPKQQKLIKLLIENYGKVGETKSMGELMVLAGYSEQSAKNPHLILDSEVIQDGIEDFVKMLDDKRRMALTKINEKKLESSNAYHLALIADVLSKNHQLLSGKATENVKHTYDELTDEQLDELIKRRKDPVSAING